MSKKRLVPVHRDALRAVRLGHAPKKRASSIVAGLTEVGRQQALLKTGALQSAIFNSANFSSIATDAKGVIQIFNVGAERMLGYTAAEVMNKITPADISDPQEVIARAKALSVELGTPIAPGFEALVFKASRGIEDIYELTYIRKDGSRFPAVVSVTALRDAQDVIIGYLLIGTDNTARKRADQSLQESEQRAQRILDTAHDAFVAMNSAGKITDWNGQAERLFGWSRREAVGLGLADTIIPPRYREAHARGLQRFLATGEGPVLNKTIEISAQHREGHEIPITLSISAVTSSQGHVFNAFIHDNTARKQAEEALLQAGALQSAIFNSANFSSIATDAKGVIQIFNVGAERMLGYTAAEVMNKITPADISDPQEVIARAKALSVELRTPITPGFEALVFKASRGIEDIYELSYIRKDGSRFPAVVSVTALRDAQNAIIGYLLIGTDNTARKQVEAERIRLDQVLQDKNAELEGAKFVAEKASLAKSDFLSSMSHELRSPLNAILGFAQLMDRSDSPPATPAQKASIGKILDAGWYLLQLINEILDLAVIESGKLSLSEESVPLAQVMLECQAMIEPEGQKRGIKLTFPRFDTPYFVRADQTRLKQVLINLLSNAIKYNRPRGAVVVDFTTTTGKRTRISVRDTGAGLSPEKLTQLFQPFNRLGQENSTEEGTGIGLVMSKRLVELMGGAIGVESTVGAGSVFWFELNSAVAPQVAVNRVEPTAVAQAQVQQGAPLRTLLYVEDNPANLNLVEQIIASRSDIRLLSAANGNLGIELARAHQPEVILMDINLPGISGIQALKILREDAVTAHIPVLAISANAMPGDIKKGLEAGFFRYLTKPIEVSEFLGALDVALEFAKKNLDRRSLDRSR